MGISKDRMATSSSTAEASDSHIRKNLFKNSGLNMGCRVLTAATSLISVPFITAKLGIDGFGAWESMVAIASLGAMFQSSVSGTLLWRISQAHGTEDYETIRRMLRLGVLAILCLLVIITPLIWMARSSLVHGLHIPERFVLQAYWVLPGVVFLTVLIGINDIMGTAISGCQRSGTITVIQACSLVINYVTAITLIRLDFGLSGLLVGMLSGALVASVMYFVTASRLCGRISLVPATPTSVELKSMGRYAGLLMVGYSSAALRDQTDKLVLARFASSTWVGYYGLAARLASLVLEVVRFFYFPLLTAAGSMYAAKNWTGVQRLFRNMTVLVGVAAGIVTVIVAGLHNRLMFMWLGYSKPQIAEIAVILLIGNTSAMILTGPGSAICRAIGKVWIETAYVMINLVGNLILTIALVLTIGPIGTVIASGSTWAVSAIAFSFFLPRFVDLPKDSMSKGRWFLFVTVVCSAITYFLANLLPKPTHRLDAAVSFFLLGAVAAAFYLAVVLVTGLAPKSAIKTVIGKLAARGNA